MRASHKKVSSASPQASPPSSRQQRTIATARSNCFSHPARVSPWRPAASALCRQATATSANRRHATADAIGASLRNWFGPDAARSGSTAESSARVSTRQRQSGVSCAVDPPEPNWAVHQTLQGMSVHAHTYPATPRVPGWSPYMPLSPRGRLHVRTPAPPRPAVTSAAAPRRCRSSGSCRSASRAGSRIARPASTPSRAPSKRSFAGNSRAGCRASDSPARSAHGARSGSSSPSRASGGACARPATAGTSHRLPRISSTTSSRPCPCGSG